MNFRYKFIRFMSGRYGVDTAFYVLMVFSVALAVLNAFLRVWPIQIVIYFIVIYALFRIFSRNIPARQRENRIITGWVYKMREAQKTRQRRRADSTHVYKKCPKCGAVLRLPKRKGKHKTICPRCGTEFTVRVHKDG